MTNHSNKQNNQQNNPYRNDLDKNPANYQPLTPLLFLKRAAEVFPEQLAIIHGETRTTYRTFYQRTVQLASALANRGLGQGDTVSALMSNTPAMLECHYGVPMAGAVLHAINPRLDPKVVAFQLDHADSKVLIVDREYRALAESALAIASVKPLVIDYYDKAFVDDTIAISDCDYDEFVAAGQPDYDWALPEDEWDAITLNYTSGTTGNPKGVVYHHRGAYLLAQGNALMAAMPKNAVYLWTLPMFHCNGWCFPWTLSLVAGVHVCLRKVRGEQIWDLIHSHHVTHLCGAPIVMNMILESSETQENTQTNSQANAQAKPKNPVTFFTAAAPPPEKTLARMNELGFQITHLYGLTETYGPAVVNEWHQAWYDLPRDEQVRLQSRQGVNYPCLEDLQVLDSETMTPVPHDGQTIGEVMFRGNIVMKGYLKNKEASDKAFAGGWFHSGDLAVVYPDGYIQLKDRSNDIIISGGENISSIEIEEALYKHPDVSVAAVVAMPDEKWGEVPCAFVEPVATANALTVEQMQQWCRTHLASYKVPKRFVFETIEKTSTGKIQKFQLRKKAQALSEMQNTEST